MSSHYQRITFLLFLLIAGAHTIITLAIGRAPSTDEVFFKAAGRSWAQGGPWAAPEETGNFSHLTKTDLETVFFSYPPGYPFLYGLTVKLFGFGWRTAVGFDAFIHVTCLLTIAYFFKIAGPATARHRWLLAASFIFIGHPGRPDELAMTFGYLGLALGMRRSPLPPSHSIASNIVFGLCGVVSVPCLLILGGIRASQLAWGNATFREKCVSGFQLAATVIIIWFVAAAPILLSNPGALEQNISTSFNHLGRNFADSFQHLTTYYFGYFITVAILILAGMLMAPKNLRPSDWKYWAYWWSGPIFTWLFFFLRNTFQGYYYIFWMPWLVAAFLNYHPLLACIHALPNFRSSITTAFALLLLLPPGFDQARHFLIQMILPAEQRWSAETPRVRATVQPGSMVLSSAHWWSVGDITQTRDLFVTRKMNPETTDYIIMTTHGTGQPGLRRTLTPAFEEAISNGEFEIIHDNLDRQYPTLFGIRLSNSAWGAGSIIYRATRLSENSKASKPPHL